MNGVGFLQFTMGAVPGQAEGAVLDPLTAGDIKQNSAGQAFSLLLNGQLSSQPGGQHGFALRLQKLAGLSCEGQDLPVCGNALPAGLQPQEMPQGTFPWPPQGLAIGQSDHLSPGLQGIQAAIQASLTAGEEATLEEGDAGAGAVGDASLLIWNPVAMSVSSSQQGDVLPQVALEMTQRGQASPMAGGMAALKAADQQGLPQAVAALVGTELPVGKDGFASLLPMPPAAMEALGTQVNEKAIEGMIAAAGKQEGELSSTPTQGGGLSPALDKPATGTLQRPALEMHMQAPLDKPEWGKDLGNRILWMTKQEVQSARVQINPPHLGPIEVRVSVHNDVANVSFLTQHGQVKEAIEMALPRLREMMDANGFSQTNVDVSDHSFARARDQLAERESGGAFGEEGMEGDISADTDDPDALSVSAVQSQGLVDYFA